jgi:alpha-beta hydrolase superfamily lysophospholipase
MVARGESTFQAPDGLELFYRWWRPEEEARAVIAVAHGLGEHSGRYEHVGQRLADGGYAVYALDHRGHGRSQGKRGHVNRFQEYLDDLEAFFEVLDRREPVELPRFLLGHSLGGLIALAYALRNPQRLRGVIVSSPALRVAVEVPWYKALPGRLLSRLWPGLTMGNELDPTALSHDASVVQAYIEDPLVHDRISVRAFTELMRAMAATLRQAPSLRVPVLIMQAGDDRLVSPEGSKRFYEALTLEDRQLTLYGGYFHELFNEVGRDAVFQEVEAWLSRHLQPATTAESPS